MSKIVQQMEYHVKVFDRGISLEVRPDRANRHSKSVEAASTKREPSPRGCITGLSTAAVRRLKKALISAHPAVGGEYRLLGLTLTIPNLKSDVLDDVEAASWAEKFRKSFNAWACAMHAAQPDVGWIWRVELQKKRMPHVHLVGFVPLEVLTDYEAVGDYSEAAISRALGRWTDTPLPLVNGFRPQDTNVVFRWALDRYGRGLWPRVVADARRLWLRRLEAMGAFTDDAVNRAVDARIISNGVHYLTDHTSKHKQEQIGWQGKQWGIVNKAALAFCSIEDIELTAHQYARYCRILEGVYRVHRYGVRLPSGRWNLVRRHEAFDSIGLDQIQIRGFRGLDSIRVTKRTLLDMVLNGEFEV